jgi:hypothetical protein
MDTLRQITLAYKVAIRLLDEDRAQDIAQDVAVLLLSWEWNQWSDDAVMRLAESLVSMEISRARRLVRIDDLPYEIAIWPEPDDD